MKTKNFFITSICLISGINNAWATGSPCTTLVDCDSVTISGTANNIASCAGGNAGTTKCYRAENGKYYAVVDCMACANFYAYGYSDAVCPNIRYQGCSSCDCKKICGGGWKPTNTAGYEVDIYTYSCDCFTGKCTRKEGNSYRCAAGYYGEPSSEGSGCASCPYAKFYKNSARNILASGTSNAGSKSITSCYVAKGTYYDDTGTFTLDSVCSYTN